MTVTGILLFTCTVVILIKIEIDYLASLKQQQVGPIFMCTVITITVPCGTTNK